MPLLACGAILCRVGTQLGNMVAITLELSESYEGQRVGESIELASHCAKGGNHFSDTCDEMGYVLLPLQYAMNTSSVRIQHIYGYLDKEKENIVT